MPIKTCAWVRARLPLMAGGDSLGLDRWVVEPHLVRCADCRRHLEALRDSQATLHAAAAEDPAAPAPEPLWPELARRLRQARRPRGRTAWGLEPRRAWIWPLAGLAAGLLVAASIIGLGARHDRRIGDLVNEYVPIDNLLNAELPRLLKPEDPDSFDRRRPDSRPRPVAPYREAHASVSPDETPSRPRSAEARPRVELTE